MGKKESDQGLMLPSIEEMFRHFLENSPIYIFFKDEKIRAIQLSKNYEQMLGRPLEEILGKEMEELFPPELAKDMIEVDQLILKKGVPVTVEEELDGHYFTTTKFPIIKEGRAPYLAGYTIDITELKLTELELIESEKRFRSIIETSQEWIWSMDLDTRHTYCNPAVEKILGYSPEEMIGLDTLKYIHEEDLPLIKKVLSTSIDQKKGWTAQVLRWRHKDGSYRYLESNSTPILSKENELIGFWGSDRDITERKQAEEQRMIMDYQIQQAQKLDSLGILAAGIAHDFNNLMSGVFGNINLAVDQSTQPEVSKYLDEAMNTIDRARGLTSQLLTFARGGEPVQMITQLSSFIQNTVQFALSGSNVSCDYHIEDSLWHCNVDKNQIGQVIDNIVINAIQAMSDGGNLTIEASNITLNTSEYVYLAAGDYIKVSIRDGGVGIPKESLSRIFEPFYTTKMKGHGLGLATSYSIINRHGGSIQVESEPGKGSVFTIYLPAVQSSVLDEDLVNLRHQGQGNMIIMDDEPTVRDILKNMLEIFGYSVTLTNNGAEILDLLNGVDLKKIKTAGFILDLTIAGGMGGAEVVQEIRKIAPDIPVFVASGYAVDPIMAHPEKYGFTDSISKPFTLDELSGVLNKHL